MKGLNLLWKLLIIVLLWSHVAGGCARRKVQSELLQSKTNHLQSLNAILILQEAVKQLQSAEIERQAEVAAMFGVALTNAPTTTNSPVPWKAEP